MVVVIIAVIAAIILFSIASVRNDVKIKRAKADIAQIDKALRMYASQYGHFPGAQSGYYFREGEEPCADIDGVNHCLSEFLNMDWGNASYYCNGCKYFYEISDGDGDGYGGCIAVGVYKSPSWESYNYNYTLCDDCLWGCGYSESQ